MANKINKDNAGNGPIFSYDYFKEDFTSLVDKFAQKDTIIVERNPIIMDKSLENTANITPLEIIVPITEASSKEVEHLKPHMQTKEAT